MSSKRYAVEVDNGAGQEPTRMYVQEVSRPNGTTYVLTNHEQNQGAHVSSVASRFGDGKIKEEISKDPSYKPESFRMYSERPERGPDGNPRFAQYEAKTTRVENTSSDPNRHQHQASEWQWRDGKRSDKHEVERSVGAEIKTDSRAKEQTQNQQSNELKEATMPAIDRQAEQQRQAQQKQQR